MKEHKVPHTGIPFQPKFEHRITEPQPFSFEKRDRKMIEGKEKRIIRQLEDERKVCHNVASIRCHFVKVYLADLKVVWCY